MGSATGNNSPTGVNETMLLALNFTGVPNCAAARAETAQHGAEMQLESVCAESDGACPDALMEDMAVPCIGASLEGRQQSREEVPSAQTF
jgi:hypothetical protein